MKYDELFEVESTFAYVVAFDCIDILLFLKFRRISRFIPAHTVLGGIKILVATNMKSVFSIESRHCRFYKIFLKLKPFITTDFPFQPIGVKIVSKKLKPWISRNLIGIKLYLSPKKSSSQYF